jgi:hypothetical protein
MRFPDQPPERMSMSGNDDADGPIAWVEVEDPEGNLVGLIHR